MPPNDLAPPVHAAERLPEEWVPVLKGWGEPSYRARQIFRWIHQRGVLDPGDMSDLPKALRARLAGEGLGPVLQVAETHATDDGTRKLLLSMDDGRQVETVLIPQLERADPDRNREPEADADGEGDAADVPRAPSVRVTQCISSQVGCAMGCTFCASGAAGLVRHMTAAEIVSQLYCASAHLGERERLRNVVFMGMGEPLHNYDAVRRAITLLMHADGLAMSPRRLTVSTCGLVPQIDRLAADFGGRVQLAISLHSPSDEVRTSIMPVNRKYAVGRLMACLRRYASRTRARVTLEYTLMRGLNDDAASAEALAKSLEGLPVKVNLIPMNPVTSSAQEAPVQHAVAAFQRVLRERDIDCFLRSRRGDAITAACGQLALRGPRRD